MEAATAEARRWKAEEILGARIPRRVDRVPPPVRPSPAAARGGVGSRAKLIRRIREADVAFESESAGIAQLARARAFQARGRGFESRFPLQQEMARVEPQTSRGEWGDQAHVAQVVERVLGKDEVSGSTPLVGSRFDH